MILRSSSELPVRSSLLRLGLMGLTGTLAILAVACSLLAWRYQEGLIEASRYNWAFDFSQAAVELIRLHVALEEVQQGAPAAQVDLRYGILQNRIAVIEGNSFLQIDTASTFNDLKTVLDEIGPSLAGGRGTDAPQRAIDRLRPFAGPLLRLAAQAHSESGDLVRSNQQDLRRMLLMICSITLTLLAVGAALIGVVLRQYGRLARVAGTDALTGLSNRMAFNRALRMSSGPPWAIALVDVDHFKAVNDTLGHDAGDRLLCALTRRLEAASKGAAILARIGGDEFAALFCGSTAATDCVAFAQRVHAAMAEPIILDGRKIVSTVTQGLRISQDGDRFSLFNDADIALYAAKAAGRNDYKIFDPAMKQAFCRRQQLLDDMRQAMTKDEFFLLYQPIVRLSDERLQGVEALLRWRHPDYGLVSPAEFIPIAEESGLIDEIGRWVIAEACRQIASWPEPLFVAVNVSARQLTDVTLPSHVADCLTANGLSEARLEIEITESVFIDNDVTALDTLQHLRALGCRIALDDFGTGYASLSYLRRFRFDKLKIDQSFVRDSNEKGDSVAIVSMVCGLAQRLGLTIVAEGIETQAQRDTIKDAGSQLGQGYFFHRPMPASALAMLLGPGARMIDNQPLCA